ncbi:molybdopterin converting factor subunit 1 [Paenibacillus sp. HJGM_3]|uniref:molybdopterin converting factor subunit 1 n=1 Tax=Paenibacillus sp. HJGM_3 TaxID=3379816 RepID=UPI00385F9B36
MKITVLVFAGLAETIGSSRLTVELGSGAPTVQALKEELARLHPGAASLIRRSFAACNQTYAADDALLAESDEVALIPPVSGGQPAPEDEAVRPDRLYTLTTDRVSVEEVVSRVQDPRYGAVLSFVGTTREYTNGQRTVLLEYEAYAPMALKTMQQIGQEIDARWPGAVCAISHRLGAVPLGEISVVIAVAAPHRAECYEASRYAIERLKMIVPIWKKEIWEDGSEWKGHQLGPWNPMQEGQ